MSESACTDREKVLNFNQVILPFSRTVLAPFQIIDNSYEMTTRKHNDFLDLEGSDDEEVNRGYDSDEKVVESKGRAVKRRRTAKSQDFLLGTTQDSEVEDDEREETPQPDIQEDEDTYLDTTSAKSSSKSKAKEKKIAKRLSSKPRKEGVVYFSSLPPYLKRQ